jgi:hypothetical protein
MRDIGGLEKRIENLEYYTALSELERDAINKQDLSILDSTNTPRFKNGILVDSFTGHSKAAVSAIDYQASIDVTKHEMRPVINVSSHSFTYNPTNSNTQLTGRFVTANTSSVSFIDQSLASRALNVNPFNVINFLGRITLDPPTDIWNDGGTPKEVTVNLSGENDAWALILKNTGLTAPQIEYSSWTTKWSGQTYTEATKVYESSFSYGIPRPIWAAENIKETGSLSRTITSTAVVPKTITKNLGDRIVDVSVIPYMRAKTVLFVGSNFKPDTQLFSFFDNQSVEKHVARANKFTLASNNLGYKTQSASLLTTQLVEQQTQLLLLLRLQTTAFMLLVCLVPQAR